MRTVVAIAQSQEQDQSALPAIQAWASLGNFGKSSKNEERDMHTWLRNLYNIQHAQWSATVHEARKSGCQRAQFFPNLEPHNGIKRRTQHVTQKKESKRN